MGTSLVFAVSGTVQSSWLSRLPAIRERVDADFAGLGRALFILGAGTLLTMALTGLLCRWLGRRRVVAGAAVAGCLALSGLGIVRSYAELVAVLLGFGLAVGAWDAAMNIQGVALEREDGRHRLTGFHGWWSVGSVAGAGLGVAAAWAGVPVATHLGVIAGAGVLACLPGAAGFTDRTVAPPVAPELTRRRPAGGLGIVALLLFAGATMEGGAGDWLAIYLTDYRRVSHALAAAGYAGFVVAIAAGRFAATRVHRAIGMTATVRSGAVLAGAGVLAVVLAPVALLAMLGALLWGLGICVVFPAALSASGQSDSSSAVVAMTTIGYGAGMTGPFLIGMLAGASGLDTALLALSGLAVILLVFAPHLGRHHDDQRRLAGFG